ncbi:MAG: hypothetical protein JWM53_7084 [bacterium]|nr:hypothetical protein [bacterium]
MRRLIAIIPCLFALAACGGSSATGTMPPAPGTGYRMLTPDLMLGGGEEKYLCFTVTLQEAADIAVTKFDSIASSAVHHFEVFQTLAPEPAGLFDCSSTLIKQSWLPLFGGGTAAGGLTLPDGSGFKIPKDAQLLLQVHLLNATAAAVTTSVTVDMTYAKDATAVTPAGIYAVGSMNINLPAGATTTVASPHCTLGKQYNVFAVQPHMHQLGTKIAFQHGATESTMQTAFQRDPWVFGVQPIEQVAMTLNAGDFVGATCTYDNTTGAPVTYGESTKNEMCFFVLFYTPFDHLNGCLN